MSDTEALDVGEGSLRRALIRRERWAASATWKRFAPRVFALLSQSLGRQHSVEEFTQEIMLRVLAEAAHPRCMKSLSSLVYGETARVLTREFRRANRFRRFWRKPRRASLELLGVVDRAERAAVMRFYDVLDQLSSEDRTLFVLHQFESLADIEIAEAVELTLLKVRKRLSRAVAKVESLVDCDPVLAAYLCDPKPPERDLREGA